MTFGTCLIFLNALAVAGDKLEIDAGIDKALQEFEALDPAFERLIHEATGVLVFPRVTKGLAVAGDAQGEGALQIKGKTIGYYSISSASVGLSTWADAPRSDIFLFTTQEALNQFTAKVDWYIDSSLAAAKIGKNGHVNYFSETLREHVLGFLLTTGDLTSDASFRGSKLAKLKL